MNQRLTTFRQLLQKSQLQGGLVRSTDCYLNEYVPTEQSRRAYLTGFTGSLGDVLVSADKAILFVDGRYAIQAKAEAPDFKVRVLPLGQSIESAWITELETWGKVKIGIETDRVSVDLFKKLKNTTLFLNNKVTHIGESELTVENGEVIFFDKLLMFFSRIWTYSQHFISLCLQLLIVFA